MSRWWEDVTDEELLQSSQEWRSLQHPANGTEWGDAATDEELLQSYATTDQHPDSGTEWGDETTDQELLARATVINDQYQPSDSDLSEAYTNVMVSPAF